MICLRSYIIIYMVLVSAVKISYYKYCVKEENRSVSTISKPFWLEKLSGNRTCLEKQHGKQEILQTLKYIQDWTIGSGIRLSVFYDLKQVTYPLYAPVSSPDKIKLESPSLVHDIKYAKSWHSSCHIV